MRLTKFRVVLLSSLLFIITIGGLLTHYATQPMSAEALEDGEWIATSKSRADRIILWTSVPSEEYDPPKKARNSSGYWDSGDEKPEMWTNEERIMRDIPQFVIDHAPYVHLYSGEEYWPSDLGDHLVHTTPFVNHTVAPNNLRHPNLADLDAMNKYGYHTFTKSDDNIELHPEWLSSDYNIPEKSDAKVPESLRFPGRQSHWRWHPFPGIREDPDFDKWWDTNFTDPHKIWEGSASAQAKVKLDALREQKPPKVELKKREDGDMPSAGGRSDAPVVMVVVDKGNDVVDAFWFYFYSYNLGNIVFNIRFGDHVGDWEHTCIRFYKGKPKAIFLSEHDNGAAYAWEAVEKIGNRPVTYSATGTHAMYATPGLHTYVLPFGLLHDMTDKGPLWDPVLNMKTFTYDHRKDVLRSSVLNPRAPTEWFYFVGHWGDKFYPLDDPRQYRFAGQYHYVSGPLGPRFKRLGRARICQGAKGEHEPCHLQYWIQERLYLSSGPLVGKGDEHTGDQEGFLGGHN